MSTNMDNDRTLWQRAARQRPADESLALDPLLLATWLDGRATPEETERVEAALAANPALLDEVAELRALRAEEARDVPASVLARARALMPAAEHAEKPVRVFLLPRAGWQAVAAAVAVLVTAPAAYRMGIFTGRRPARANVPAEVRAIFTQDSGAPDLASVLRGPDTAAKGGRQS